ncbi:putative Y-family DNA polymerase, partial [Haematococcus lacustris]
QIDLGLESDRRLVVAAAIAKRLRDAVLSDKACGYTCSAGIAQNKMLAKLGSARNKPAQQTLILPRVVAGLMQ